MDDFNTHTHTRKHTPHFCTRKMKLNLGSWLLLTVIIVQNVTDLNALSTSGSSKSNRGNTNNNINNSKSGSNRTITHTANFDNVVLNHLIVDRNTGRVIIGGKNRLYQLSPDLQVVITETTGPKNDSFECTILDCPQAAIKTLTDNVNKVLLIDYSTSRLITCGSLFQGICDVRNLQNISIIEQQGQEAVVANNADASTVAFIAPGPPNPPVTTVMYVGVTFTSNSAYRSEIPAVASRSLDAQKIFQIAASAVTTGTRMFINSYARESYLVNYVYGFSSEKFSYFLTTQLKHNSHAIPKEYITKLVRICHEDTNYYSYTEIPVDCIGGQEQQNVKYNLVRAAYLANPGSDLAESMGITIKDDVLFAVFSDGKGNQPSNRSALCIYPLKAIRRKFMQNIKACFSGTGQRGLEFISPNMACVPTVSQVILLPNTDTNSFHSLTETPNNI